MLQITPQMKILLAVEPVDFRKGIDGLVQVCKSVLGQDPFGGAMFAFRNRRATSLKILVYDGQGFWLCQKRLSVGRFAWWPQGADSNGQGKRLASHQLQVLLCGGNPDTTKAAPDWRPVTPTT